MAAIRKPFQGVYNIIRFNWHFYILSIVAIFTLYILAYYVEGIFQLMLYLIGLGVLVTTMISLLVSFYVYDCSSLYRFDWLEKDDIKKGTNILNINAGFDETSSLLIDLFKNTDLTVVDFYDPQQHTEVSIKRARKAYPAFPNTINISTSKLELSTKSVDVIFAFLSAHEIRDDNERIVFFKELNRVLKPNGQIIVTEHLRDIPNFLAYNIGFFHFHSKASWLKTFNKSRLEMKKEMKITPFISTFILKKNGTTS